MRLGKFKVSINDTTRETIFTDVFIGHPHEYSTDIRFYIRIPGWEEVLEVKFSEGRHQNGNTAFYSEERITLKDTPEGKQYVGYETPELQREAAGYSFGTHDYCREHLPVRVDAPCVVPILRSQINRKPRYCRLCPAGKNELKLPEPEPEQH